MLKFKIGLNYFDARAGRTVPVEWDSSKLTNPHLILLGSSGVGKSYTLIKMIRRALKSQKRTQVRFHVFDVHGDIAVPGASTVRFSETSPYGLNPLVVNPDPDFGGVRRCIQNFIRVVNQASTTNLGLQQENILTNLLIDVYKEHGFDIDDPDTWGLNAAQVRLAGSGGDNRLYMDVPMAEKDAAKALGARWDSDKKLWWVHTERYTGEITKWPLAFKARTYPTVKDVLTFARRIHLERFLGSDQRAVVAVNNLQKRARAFQTKLISMFRSQNARGGGADLEAKAALETARTDAVDAYVSYVKEVKTGEELNNIIRYESADVLKSVSARLENLLRTGIFKDKLPPFDPENPVWRYYLLPLDDEEKKMFVLFKLNDLFQDAKQRGITDDIVDVIILDELGTYTAGTAEGEGGTGIIGKICREARKFGLAFWGATQSPSTVPESVMTSTATKLLLGLDETFWPQAMTKLRIELKLLEWVQVKKTMAVQLKESGSLKNKWAWVQMEDDD